MIGLETARQLLDFRGPTGALSRAAAEEQLKGAVALRNILERQRVAYLADEVGMGKTYVALGALALLRHFDPRLRVLVIAPRANIQRKWIKELRNFVRNNVRVADLRVKAVHGGPARPIVACANLAELVRETALNPERDFFARLSSFSLPLGSDVKAWKRRRKELLKHLPWADPAEFDLRSRERFKEAYGRTLCAALPEFDLVIVDEGHNLKHGFGAHASDRNRVLGLAFGHPSEASKGWPGYGPRARRVLFLSATPLEGDYEQIWRQLDVFGLGDVAPELSPHAPEHVTDEQKRARTQEFLIRRLASIRVAGVPLTKNLYRREWRAGGVSEHDHPLEISGPDRDRQRLIVALVQKKVSEVLGHARFNQRFQIGMLASFESFLQTTGVWSKEDADEAHNFDGDQTDDPDERLGADVGQVNRLAASYRRTFDGRELPHPKMDALIDHLAEGLPLGRKALVFVRRVASVKELQTKLEERYDEWLFDRLRRELPSLRPELERAFSIYRSARAQRRILTTAPVSEAPIVEDDGMGVPPIDTAPETSSLDSFFAWFFRGDGPDGFLSGAALKKRFERPGSAYSTFFEDNYAAWLLDVRPGHVLEGLAAHLGRDRQDVLAELRRRAGRLLPPSQPARAARRLHLFVAMQAAALELLAQQPDALGERTRVTLRELALGTPRPGGGGRLPEDAESWLETRTFFSELRARPELRARLWPEPHANGGTRAALRDQELRRCLLSGQARLGHAFLDLYILALQSIDDLRPGARDEDAGTEGLVERYLDLLDQQRVAADGRFRAFQELSLAAEHFDLIVDVNRPELRTMPLGEAARDLGRLLGSQQPVGGMFGAINDTLVRQFRLPGYPFVLFTTDLLQEGEDLHTFCSAVHHYGISWMPSSMEQRAGRVDRVNSHTERRLARLSAQPEGSEKLQVYFPHLRDTIEVLQVRRVLGRMNRFLRLMHRDLRQPEGEEQRVDLAQAMLAPETDIEPITAALETAFPVRDEWLEGPVRPLAFPEQQAHELLERFRRLGTLQPVGLPIDWEPQQPSDDVLLATAGLMSGRRQPFSLMLRSWEGRLMVRCVSPVGSPPDGYEERVRDLTRGRPVQVALAWEERFKTYKVNVKGEVLLGPPAADAGRVVGLIGRVVSMADDLERELLDGADAPLSQFKDDLSQESPDAGH